jgi:hypothetical protein
MDPLYLSVLVSAEKKFWRCVQSGEPPHPINERAKSGLKALIPEDAKEAIGHGLRGKRSRSGAVSFDLLETEARHAPIQ